MAFHELISSGNIYVVIPIILWSIFWKAVALWKSARQDQGWWFIIFVFLNTLGVVELIYLQFFQRKGRPLIKWRKWKDIKA